MEGIGADDIRVKELIARLRDGVVQEVYPRDRPGCRRGSNSSVFGALIKSKWHQGNAHCPAVFLWAAISNMPMN